MLLKVGGAVYVKACAPTASNTKSDTLELKLNKKSTEVQLEKQLWKLKINE